MGIVGTVDSAYKATGGAMAGRDGSAIAVRRGFALGSSAVVVFDTLGPSAGVRGPAPGQRTAEEASMQRGRRRGGAMGDEGHEAQARAAEYASGCGGGSIEAREEILDRERRGLNHGRLAERGTRLIEPRARALAVEAVAAHGLEPRLGQVREASEARWNGWSNREDRTRLPDTALPRIAERILSTDTSRSIMVPDLLALGGLFALCG